MPFSVQYKLDGTLLLVGTYDGLSNITTVSKKDLKEENLITIAQVRDMFSTSRKSAKPILEYMDSIKVTKKTGGESERVAYL